MKKESLSALTNAHAWVGLVISTALFIVFLAGSFSLFRDNIQAWERDPHIVESTAEISKLSIDQIVQTVVSEKSITEAHHFTIWPPGSKSPYYEITLDIEDEQGNSQYNKLIVSPKTGEILSEGYIYTLAGFLYRLHVDLKIPVVGVYLVGIVTLFFFVALISGIAIHWRKIAKNFYQYRKNKRKDKYLDGHNLLGVMGLPFHIMYALTGLIFNLVIIYQIAYALVLYQGDQTALLKDAGYDQPHLAEIGNPTPMTGLDTLHHRAKQTLGVEDMRFISIEHFGDESAFIAFGATEPSTFAVRKEVIYQVSTQEQLYVTMDNYDNAVRSGLQVLHRLHFGDFAGYGIRLAFFLLGIGTCYIILTGNLMWLEKRAKNKHQSKTGLHVVKAITSGGFIGAMAAITVAFIAARTLPIDLVGRSDMVSYSFGATLFICVVLALFTKNFARYNAKLLNIIALSLLAIPILDWTMLTSGMISLITQGRLDVLIVEAILLLFAACCWVIGQHLTKKAKLANYQAYGPSPTPTAG